MADHQQPTKRLQPLATTRWLTLLLVLTLSHVLSACDWDHFALMNSIPFDGRDPNKDVYVYIGVDGLAYAAAQDALAMGTHEANSWKLSKMISMFPGTSDAAWSRVLQTKRMEGYEYQYYDPVNDAVANAGYYGLIAHAIPPFEFSPVHVPSYIGAFDYWGNGYLDTYWKYRATDESFGDSLDALFFLLGGRGKIAPVFSAYVMEIDVMGHMQTREKVVQSIVELTRRIENFKRRHRERNYIFTLFSDHGMDFISAKSDELLEFGDVLASVGVKSVKTFAEGRRLGGLFAVPIVHTRVSYVAMHTQASMAEQVAKRTSQHVSVDFSLARSFAPVTPGAEAYSQWFGVWRDGERVLQFGYNHENDTYFLPAPDAPGSGSQASGTPVSGSYDAFGIALDFAEGEAFKVLTDEQLFALSATSEYPDMLFRVRTAFEPVSVLYPSDVFVSFRRPYASLGFKMPGGANEIASSGFHGAMDDGASAGVILTQERDLPPVVRSDSFLDLFPRLLGHMRDRSAKLRESESNYIDANTDLDYFAIP